MYKDLSARWRLGMWKWIALIVLLLLLIGGAVWVRGAPERELNRKRLESAAELKRIGEALIQYHQNRTPYPRSNLVLPPTSLPAP